MSFKEEFWKDFILNKLTDTIQDTWIDNVIKSAIHEIYLNEEY